MLTAPIGEHDLERMLVRRTPVRAVRAAGVPPAEMLAFSIPEFCRTHGISRAHFYNLWKSGDAPAVMRVGRRTLVSAEAAAEWRRRMESVREAPTQ
jgi:predicted DNA-binding transcriptional regulator AlpA